MGSCFSGKSLLIPGLGHLSIHQSMDDGALEAREDESPSHERQLHLPRGDSSELRAAVLGAAPQCQASGRPLGTRSGP